MPQPPTLKIHEIFASLQGEGLRQGEPTLFIRLSGCNLRCGFCDTREAWEGGRERSVPDILEEVRRAIKAWPTDWVCLTGGEPLLQNLEDLAAALKAEGFKLQIETNGTLFQSLPIDWWTVSPKPPDYRVRREILPLLKEIKLILTHDLDLKTIKKMRDSVSIARPIILQPVSHQKWSIEKGLKLLKQASLRGLRNVRFSLQMHKIIDIR